MFRLRLALQVPLSTPAPSSAPWRERWRYAVSRVHRPFGTLIREPLLSPIRICPLPAVDRQREIKERVFEDVVVASAAASTAQEASIFDLLHLPDNHDAILQFVKANDIEIEQMGLSNRPKNRLISKGYSLLSNIIFLTRPELQKIPSMGKGSIDEILEKRNSYLSENETRLIAVIHGDTSALWDDKAIKKMDSLNAVIKSPGGLGAAFQIGPAYFLKLKDGNFDSLWEMNIEPLLREYLRGIRKAEELMRKFKHAYIGETEDANTQESTGQQE